eukprot:3987517-Alexandrium_andersonii.AAC.1
MGTRTAEGLIPSRTALLRSGARPNTLTAQTALRAGPGARSKTRAVRGLGPRRLGDGVLGD